VPVGRQYRRSNPRAMTTDDTDDTSVDATLEATVVPSADLA
jgi:hypothetical protein